MPEFENSEVMKYVLNTLINISSRKTTQGQAVSTMNNLIEKLKNKYDFLKHIEIKDTRYLELDDPISVMSDIDNIKSDNIGKALYEIIKNMNIALGRDAGFFFFKELKRNLGDDYSESIEDMGLDLGLMQLEFEVNEITKKL